MVGICHRAAWRRFDSARMNADLMDQNFQDPARLITLRNSLRSCSQGLDVRISLTSNAEGKCFFLTSPFIEPSKSNPSLRVDVLECYHPVAGFDQEKKPKG